MQLADDGRLANPLAVAFISGQHRLLPVRVLRKKTHHAPHKTQPKKATPSRVRVLIAQTKQDSLCSENIFAVRAVETNYQFSEQTSDHVIAVFLKMPLCTSHDFQSTLDCN